jgi:hypothetical protein
MGDQTNRQNKTEAYRAATHSMPEIKYPAPS